MKRVLLYFSLIFIVFGIVVSIPFRKYIHIGDELEVPFKISEGKIYRRDDELNPFNIIGLNLVSTLPGSVPGEDGLDDDVYWEWLTLIKELGVTVIRLPYLLPTNFYSVLKSFNETQETPLYFLQGIYFDEVALADGANAQDLEAEYKNKIGDAINCIYGQGCKQNEDLGTVEVSTDVSNYLLGYSLGLEWATQDIIFSEIMEEDRGYEGKYFYTTDTASSFDAFLAKLSDYLVSYEVKNFHSQHLVTLVGSSYDDLMNSEEILAGTHQMQRVVDFNSIKPTEALESGFFASYHLYPTLEENLGESVKQMLVKLSEMQDVPIMISEYGIPSSQAVYTATAPDVEVINETQQGLALSEIFRAIQQSNVIGGFVSDWLDRWDRTAWTTVEEVILDQTSKWSNPLTYLQSMGLYTFEASSMYPDSTIAEWTEKNVLSENEQLRLSVKEDEEGIFFLIQLKETPPSGASYWIDLDVTPESGSMVYSEANLNFEQAVDFLININPGSNSRVLVQRYYDTYEFLENKTNLQIRPDLIEVTPTMDEFVPIMLKVKSRAYNQGTHQFTDAVAKEVGDLVEGNGNPSAEDFNSLANYYVGSDYIEIKIPWSLLNFSDPSTNQIHKDYYKEFGIESRMIQHISVGLTEVSETATARLSSINYGLKPWMNPTYETRLKQSYDILKDAFLSEGR